MLIQTKSDYQGYSCKFNPFSNDVIACGYSQYYGIIGNGMIGVYTFDPKPIIKPLKMFDTNEGVFDISWSEVNKNHLVSCGADGSLKLWDITHDLPLFSIKVHNGEIWSCAWSHLITHYISSTGTDTCLNITDVIKGKTTLTLKSHTQMAYSSIWHPTMDNVLSSTSADGTCKLWDIKSGNIIKQYNHSSEILHCDFNKYESLIAVASADGLIFLFDLRGSTNQPIKILKGHQLAVRKIVFSPFEKNLLYSVSYDMNINIWDIALDMPVKVLKNHTEFVYGVDCSLFDPKIFATTGWDNMLNIYSI